MDERRSSPRIRAYRPVRLQHISTPRAVETLTKDFSVGGLRCLSSTLFPVSTELTIQLVLSSGREPIRARGRTVWFRTIPQSDQFDLGIAFLEIPAHDKRRLSAYIENLSRNPSSVLA